MHIVRHSLLLGMLLPACVVAKSVGDEPESQGVENDGSASESSSTSGGSISASSSQSGTGQSEPDYASCGVTIVPPGGGPVPYFDIVYCDGGCTIALHSAVPTGWNGDPEMGDCLCASIGCGGWSMDPVTTDPPTTDTTTGASGCGFEPEPWDGQPYSVTCGCETCNVSLDALSPDDANMLFDDAEICDCLCEQAGCGGLGISVGDVGPAESSGGTSSSG
jgi:hypothetical protein